MVVPKIKKEGSGAAWPAIVVGVFVAFGGILFGYECSSHYPNIGVIFG